MVNQKQAKVIKLIYGEFITGPSCHAIAEKLAQMGIKTPRGKDVWSQTTVRAILTNEKYKGDALLQKTYTPDFLTKKQVANYGEVPQYYVENNHEAIIEPEIFDRVQDMMQQRSLKGGYSGITIFSSKIACGECGGWYDSKVWHSTDKYRRVIWQCKITHSSECARFLGYDICVRRNDESKKKANGTIQRTLNNSVELLVPLKEKIEPFLLTKGIA